MGDAARRRVDVVLVWKLDRAARSAYDDLTATKGRVHLTTGCAARLIWAGPCDIPPAPAVHSPGRLRSESRRYTSRYTSPAETPESERFGLERE